MYSLKIAPKYLKNLWELREYAGQGPIASQINRSIEMYIQTQREELAQIEKELEREEQEDLNQR